MSSETAGISKGLPTSRILAGVGLFARVDTRMDMKSRSLEMESERDIQSKVSHIT
jgi:hypothetical protein